MTTASTMARRSGGRFVFLYMVFAAGILKGIGATVNLINNGYEGVVVVIKDTVKEDADLIDRIQEEFTDASKLLFTATKNRAYFRNITIVVPKTWNTLQRYKQIPAVNVFTEHIRVDRRNKMKRDAPYVRGNVECGKAGWFMHLTPGFLKQKGETPYGNHENAIVHEWGHLRWGLFDEYPSIDNPNANKPSKKINFYTESGSWKPVTCSKAITGNAYEGNCNVNKPCNLKSVQLSAKCKFCPDKNQPGVRSSLMAVQWLQTMDSFCEEDAESTDSSVRHNSKAHNLQNKICNGQSAWEVMNQHEDFRNENNAAANPTTSTTPSFQIMQEKGRIRMFVFDVSGSMAGDKIITQKQAALLAIDNLVETGSWLGIVSFTDSAILLANLTEINRKSRKQLRKKVPDSAGGGTQIYQGLKLAVETIENKFMTKGSEIILLSDGKSNGPYLDDILKKIQPKEITVHTIAITNSADHNMTVLAQRTSGSSFTYLETEAVSLADVLGQAITNGNTDSDSTEKIFSESYNISSGSYASGTFTIDVGLGNNTKLTILLRVTNNVSADVIGPNNEEYHVENSTDMLTLELPDSAEVGTYLFNITTASTSTISLVVSVTSQPLSKDDDVLRVVSRLSTNTLDFKSSEEMKVYTNVEKGGSPVLNANVMATLAADSGYVPTQISMIDSGTGADAIPNDGIYSAYLLKNYFTSSSRRYNIKIRIVGDGNAFTYTTDAAIGGRSTSIPGEIDEIDFEELQLDQFQRQSIPGEITVVNYISNQSDTTPPAKITDLNVDNVKINIDDQVKNITYALSWTAVGDDMDIGQAASYDLRVDKDNRILRKNFTNSQPVLFPSMNSPKQSGEQERINITFTTDECNGTCFLALRARDNSGLDSEISNLISIDVDFSYETEEDYTETTTGTTEDSTSPVVTKISPNVTTTETKSLKEKWVLVIIGGVVGLLVASVVSAMVITCVVKRRSKYKVRRKHVESLEKNGHRQPNESVVTSRYSNGNDNQEMPVFGHIL